MTDAQKNLALAFCESSTLAIEWVGFTRTGGYIQHRRSGQTINFRREKSVYRMEVDALTSRESGFNRPGKWERVRAPSL